MFQMSELTLAKQLGYSTAPSFCAHHPTFHEPLEALALRETFLGYMVHPTATL